MTTFDSVNILALFNMQPELLCKDEGWGGRGQGGVKGEGSVGVGVGWTGEQMLLEFDVVGMK